MKPSATLHESPPRARLRILLYHAMETTVLAALVALMGWCMTQGPRLAALLLP